MRHLTCNNLMAYLKNCTDNFFQIFFMGTSWVAVSINNIKNRASREMTSQKILQFSILLGWTLPSTGMWRGEVFAISDCLVPVALLGCHCLKHFRLVDRIISNAHSRVMSHVHLMLVVIYYGHSYVYYQALLNYTLFSSFSTYLWGKNYFSAL